MLRILKAILDYFFPEPKPEPRLPSKEKIAYWTARDRQQAKDWLGDSWKS